MSDQFDVLRGTSVAVSPDPEFRARVAAMLRSELSAGSAAPAAEAAPPSPPPVVRADAPTVELGDFDGPRRRRFVLAVLGVGAAAAVLGLIMLNRPDEPEPPIGTQPTVPLPAGASTVPTTTEPPTTSTTVPATTTTVFVNPLSDTAIASQTLLAAAEYAPLWVDLAAAESKRLTLDRRLAATVPGCAQFLDVVFESEARPAVTTDRSFFGPTERPAVMGQYVVVFPTEDAAVAMFEAMEQPEFSSECIAPYGPLTDTDSDQFCCDLDEPGIPALRGAPVTVNDLLGADDLARRSDTQSWEDAQGVIHGPETIVSATIRVGRVISIIETITVDEFGAEYVTEADFDGAIATVVERSRAGLRGEAIG